MSQPASRIRPAVEADLAAINRIYNDEVLHGIATWDLEPWSEARRREWFREHDAGTPVLVAEHEGELAGFAYLSAYRGKPGYRFTRENTVFVDPRLHRRGIGRLLLAALIEEARRLRLRTLVAWIEAGNAASIELHRAAGYTEVGHERETGYKFGRWLDAVEMQLLLDRPEV
jgi:L-amino acid N-acyltransferase